VVHRCPQSQAYLSVSSSDTRCSRRFHRLSQVEPALGVSSASDHGVAALDLAVEGASPLLLSLFESPCWVRLPIVDPTRTPLCPIVASNGRRPAARAAVAAWAPAWPSLPRPPYWAKSALGRSLSRTDSPFPALATKAESNLGPVGFLGPAQ
jgi:hypothetical protein